MVSGKIVIRTRTINRCSAVAGAALFCVAGIAALAFISSWTATHRGVLTFFAICMPALIPAFLALGIGTYWIAVTARYRAVFGSESLSVKGHFHPLLRSFDLRYADIQTVERGSNASWIRLRDARGASYQVQCGPLDGGTDGFLSELESRVPRETFEPGIRTSVRRRSSGDRAAGAVALLFGGCLLLLLLSLSMDDFLVFPVVWQPADGSLLRASVENLRIDSRGNRWSIQHDRLFPAQYHLVRAGADGTKSWRMPAVEGDSPFSIGLAEDRNREPWLIMGRRLAHWENGAWAFLDMPLGARLWEMPDTNLAVDDSIVWGIDQAARDRIIRLDLSQTPGAAEAIPLPIPPASGGCQIGGVKLLPGGGLLAVIHSDTLFGVYRLEGGAWREIASVPKDVSRETCVSDFAMDSGGSVWVLSSTIVENKDIGKFDPQQNAWTWMNIRHPSIQGEIGEFEFGYSSLAVDPFGRVWISGDRRRGQWEYELSYEMVGVYEPQGESLVEIRHYTSENSSLEAAITSHLLQSPDGRIWSWGDQLVWTQGGAQDLPQPLPEGISNWNRLADLSAFRSCMVGLLILLTMVYLAFVLVRMRQAWT